MNVQVLLELSPCHLEHNSSGKRMHNLFIEGLQLSIIVDHSQLIIYNQYLLTVQGNILKWLVMFNCDNKTARASDCFNSNVSILAVFSG